MVSYIPEKVSNYDEVCMQESLIFSNKLQDLRNLRTQLYSAAEYFELSYTNDDQKKIVMNTLKDYAIKALVSTVDHIGSVTYKVDDLFREKVREVSCVELGLSCIEQRVRTCQQHIDLEGLSQQSLVINTPRYHKRYILPVGEARTAAFGTKSKHLSYSLAEGDESHQFRKVARALTVGEISSTTARKRSSSSPSPRPLQPASSFLFNGSTQKKELDKPDKRTVSPHGFPLIRSGSLSSRPTTLKSRATTPNRSHPQTTNAVNELKRYPSAPRRSASMHIHPDQRKESPKKVEQQPSKTKSRFKSLLSRRKSKKDDMLYTYLDEY